LGKFHACLISNLFLVIRVTEGGIMGSPARHKVFSDFLRKQFGGKVNSVLVVADGKGHLAVELAKWIPTVRVIEAKPRQEVRRKRIRYQRGWFDRNSEVGEDLVVGMHPDEATSEIVRAAVRNKKRWAVVPCCIMGPDALLVTGYQKMSGKNVVIWGYKK
jgi:hypothetical protein